LEGTIDSSLLYVVTARHCIDNAQKYGQVYIRVNRKKGKFLEFPTRAEDWLLHDNADVAAIPVLRNASPVGVEPTDLDFGSLGLSSFVGNGPDYKVVAETNWGPKEIQPRVGHQVYSLGLFTEHYGAERNLPIAKFGHISRMPDNVELKIGDIRFSVVAYLVEFHSLGGHSGSPVFFLYPLVTEDQIRLPVEAGRGGEQKNVLVSVNLAWISGFMGLISAHYDIEKEAKKTGNSIEVELNSGIAVVTPAEAVSQLLMREDLVDYRKNLARNMESKRRMPTLDVVESASFTKHDFERALKKVSRKTKK